LEFPTSFNASKAIPPVNAPSPMTATTLYFSFFISLAHAKPRAAEMDVLLCPAAKKSYSLSLGFGKPLNP